MNVTLIPSAEFLRNMKKLAKKYKSIGEDYRKLKQSLFDNPFQGVELGGGVRKIRLSIGSKGGGKSGGARVLTLTILISENTDVTLLSIYDKSEIDNVNDEYIKWHVKEAKKRYE